MIDLNIFFQIGEWIGTAAFAVSGAMIAVDTGTDIFGVMVLAVVTALGGGTLRDVLIKEIPFVLKKRIYAVAAIAGALCYALMVENGLSTVWAYSAGWAVTTALRLLATVFRWDLPKAL